MAQVNCGCGCGSVIPDVALLALHSRFAYGASHRATSLDTLCPKLKAEAISPAEYRQAA